MLLSVLACIELYPDDKLPPRLNFSYKLVEVPADGRCFWSCLWLGSQATKFQLYAWYHRKRNPQGIAEGKEDAGREKDLVCHWALRLVDMPQSCHNRLMRGECAQQSDADP